MERRKIATSGIEPLLTPWGESVDSDCPHSEYPRPQMRRGQWQCLNGRWDYAIRGDASHPAEWDGCILVPFSPESVLSGVSRQLLPGQTLWYRRRVWWEPLDPSQRLLLHFGAVDQRCSVYVNGVHVGDHSGGYWPFALDVTEAARAGTNRIEVSVQDDSDTGIEAYGKQKLKRGKIWYTPQSGIWQTVWCEVVPRTYIESVRIEPDCFTDEVRVRVISSDGARMEGIVHVFDQGDMVASSTLDDNDATVVIPHAKRWSPSEPFLYDVVVNAGEDEITSYVGMREFGTATTRGGHRVLTLNGEPIFHNGLLDQGYWSDGMYTPPSDEAMIWELTTIKSLGYNMVRKHIKIEPLRWYHHCDRLGILVWQDFVSGGGPYNPLVVQVAPWLGVEFGDGPGRYQLHGRGSRAGRQVFLRDMGRTIELLRNVTSLCVWVPFNEGWGQFDSSKIAGDVRAMDPSRLIDHASGYFDQGAGDFDSHHVYFKGFRPKRDRGRRVLALTEFGGFSLATRGSMASDKEFGYKVFRDRESLEDAMTDLYERDVMARIPDGLGAVVYTQVSDVEDEINGLFTYDRRVVKPDQEFLVGLNAQLYAAFTIENLGY